MAVQVRTNQIEDAAVTTAKVADLGITTAKIAASAVTATELANGAVSGAKIPAGGVGAGHLAAAAKTEALQSKLIVQDVVSADRTNPAATTSVVTTDAEWAFNTTAGIDGNGSTLGYPVLLEVAGGTGNGDYNTTTSKPAPASDPAIYRLQVLDTSGNELLDSAGAEVWAVISAGVRNTTGPYTLRFYSGEYGSGSEAPVTVNSAFKLLYPQLTDLSAMTRAGLRKSFVAVSGQAAGLAAGQVTSTHLATGAVTAGKIATGGVSAAGQFAAGVVDSAALGSAAVTAGKVATGGISAAGQFAAGVVDSAALGSAAVTAGKIATGGVSAAGQFAAGVVDTAALGTDAVTTPKIATGAVTADEVGTGAISNTHVNASAGIAESKLADLGKEGASDLLTNIRQRDGELHVLPTADGVIVGTGTLQVQAQATPNMTVRIPTAGTIYLDTYRRTAVASVSSLAIAASDPTNPRYDVISSDANGTVAVTQGTPAGSPTEPTPASPYVKLAVVKVGAGVTTITSANVFDHRRFSFPQPQFENATADGTLTTVNMTRRALNGIVQVYRNGVRLLKKASPTTMDDYDTSNPAETNGTRVTFGAAPTNLDKLFFDYLG